MWEDSIKESFQSHINNISSDWLKNWQLKVNAAKSTNVTFPLKIWELWPSCVYIHHNTRIPQSCKACYLWIHLDKNLTWKCTNYKKDLNKIETRSKQLCWLLNQIHNCHSNQNYFYIKLSWNQYGHMAFKFLAVQSLPFFYPKFSVKYLPLYLVLHAA